VFSVYHRILVGCLAVTGALLYFLGAAGAQLQKQDGKSSPNRGEIYVIMKTRLYEVDEAFHNKVAKAKWHSQAELDEQDKSETKRPTGVSLFAQLEKQKPYLTGKDVNIDLDKSGALLTATKPIKCLPTPDQLRQGRKEQQTTDEGFTLSAQVQISADRRFVRAKFLEKSVEIEGIEKVKVVVDEKGTEAVSETVFTKEASFSQSRYIFDGGSIMVPVHHRPPAVRDNERWLIAVITTRIYIEEEEKLLRGKGPQ
jgi:hypothetical protein